MIKGNSRKGGLQTQRPKQPKRKNYKRCRNRMPTRTHHRDQLLHTNVTCGNRNSMQTNIIQLGKRQREKEEKKKDERFTKSLHRSVIVFVNFPISIRHGDLIHIREQSTDHGVSGRPRKLWKLKVRQRCNKWTLQQGKAIDIICARALNVVAAFSKKWRKKKLPKVSSLERIIVKNGHFGA